MYYQEHKEKFSGILKELKNKRVAVIGHMRPDGDCIGSQVGLVRGLRALGIDAIALNKDPVPKNLRSFVGDTPFVHEQLSNYKGYTAITVDCSDIERLGDELIGLFPKIKLNIDHHISNRGYGENNIVVGEAAASCEILAGLFLDNGVLIDAVTAQALYLGIATDTGQFCYSATNAQVFAIAMKLVELGAVPSKTANELYEHESLNGILLLKEFLGTLKMELEGKLCIGRVTYGMMQSTGTGKEDTEGFVDYPRSIEGVQIAALIEERADGTIKGSLRGKEDRIRVDVLAKEFNGGGHVCAAGFSFNEKMDLFYPKFIEAAKKHLESLGL